MVLLATHALFNATSDNRYSLWCAEVEPNVAYLTESAIQHAKMPPKKGIGSTLRILLMVSQFFKCSPNSNSQQLLSFA